MHNNLLVCFFVGLRERFNFKGAGYFVASGLISEIMGSASFMQSLRFGISVALPVIQSQVIFTAIFSYLLLRERISKKAYAGIVVIFTGLVILAYSQFSYVEAQDPLSGCVFCAGCINRAGVPGPFSGRWVLSMGHLRAQGS